MNIATAGWPAGRRALAAAAALLALGLGGGVAFGDADVVVSHPGGAAGDNLDFGRVRVGSTVGAGTVTVTNNGPDATSMLDVAVDDADFAVSGLVGTLGNGASDDITVTCNPAGPGSHTATVTISWENPASSTITFPVTCYAPAIWINSADPLDFGDQEAGTTSNPATTITLFNDDSVDVSVTGVTTTGANCGEFADDLATPTIGAGGMVSVDLTFSPGARGARGPCNWQVNDDSAVANNSIDLQGNGVGATLARSTSSMNLGNQRVNTTGSDTFTISNNGDTGFDLNITGITVTGTHNGDYTVMPTTATIAPGGNQMFTVEFTPSAAGTRTATLNINANEPLDLDTTISLTGNGTEALLTTNPASSLPLGNVRINGGSSNDTIAMNNGGDETVTVSAVNVTGNTGQFNVIHEMPPFTIAGGASKNISVTCDPTTVGAKSITISIVSDDDGSSPDEVTATCRGVKSHFSISDDTDIDFGNVLVNTTATVQRTITNVDAAGANDTTLNATLSGSPAQFDTSIASIVNLAVGGSQNFNVEFTPNSEGPFSGTISITHDDPAVSSPVVINVSGTGVKPEINLVTASTVDFGNVQVGATSGGRTVTIENLGSSNLTISSVTRTGGQPGQFAHTPTTSNIVIPPSGNADWTVTCSPTTTGLKTTTLRFANDDANENPLDVALRCTGVQANLVISPSPVDFGDVNVCETSDIVVDLDNQGTAPLTVSSLMFSSSDFSKIAGPNPNFDIGAGTARSITVRFDPSAAGVRDGTLTIVSTDPNSPTEVQLAATGVVSNMSLDTSSHDFGDVRLDQSFPAQTFTITNDGTDDLQIVSLALSNTTHWTVTPLSPASLPTTLSSGQTATFRVTSTPQTLGSKTATVTINTDAPSAPCGPSVLTLNLDAVGVVPDLSLSPGTIEFGPADVQAAPTTRDISIENTGTAPLLVSDLQLSGIDAARYNVTSSALPFTVAVGQTGVVQVTYSPVTVSSGDDASLRITTDAQSGMTMDIPLSGRGIDREIRPSTTALDFPETYRNTDDPPQLMFEISNAGEAPLAINMVNKTGGGENAFSVVDRLEDTIDGLSEDVVVVSFSPSSAGLFEAVLEINNDDDQRPRVEIALQGRGRVPNFMPDRGVYDMNQGECDLSSANPTGCIGVGIPTRLTAAIPEGIRFTNLEPQAFQVRELRLVDDQGVAVDPGLFRVVDFQSESVGPNQLYSVDIELVAPAPGTYEATLEVYLDNDPERVQFVTIRATAVEVELRGGGCDSGTGGTGLAAGLLALLGLLVGRRRARALAALALMATLALPQLARADRTRNLDLGTFRPMPTVEAEMLSVETPEVGASGAWFLGLFFNHAVNPLNLESPQIIGFNDALVGARTAMDLGFSYAFADRFEAGLLVPMLTQSGSDSMTVRGVEAADGFSLGDVALHGKAELAEAGPLVLGASTTVTLPTARDGQFAGVDGPTGHFRAIAAGHAGRVSVNVNGGFRARGSGEFGDLEQSHELTYGLGTSFRAQRQLWVVGELFGAFGMGDKGSTQGASPLEVALGARYRMSREVSLVAGVGTGILPGIGAPDFRGLAFVTYAPRAEPIAAFGGGGQPRVVDRGDDDGDDIINAEDRCPGDAEDMDGFADDDGCPDPDNDEDGLPDGSDPCPLEAEDKDGYKDEDGCPDLDNDEDGIPDSEDTCPDEPEDKDGFQDRDGCDDPDNDTDGIPDVIDQCATEAETINGKDDDDGCPDAGESLVMVMPDRIEVFEPVKFVGKSDRIHKQSHNVLGQVAATLRANRDFLRVRIGVHVHPRGKNDLKLTRERAASIRTWLTKWGIEPERLEVKGYGSTRPLVPKNKRGAAKVNDRVEFVILEKKIKK